MTHPPQDDARAKPIFEAVVNGNELETYDPVEKITIHLSDGYTFDLAPMECTQLVCRVKK